jgi:hypothetical protein
MPVYPGLYQQPPEPPRIDLTVFFRVLFSPKSAFLDLYNHTTKMQGIVVTIIFTTILAVLNIAIAMMRGGFLGISQIFSTGNYSNLNYMYTMTILSVPLAIVGLYLSGYFSAIFSKSIGQGRGDVDKTIGLLGYGVILTFFIGIIQIAVFSTMPSFDFDGNFFEENSEVFFQLIGVLLIFGMIGFIWGLWVNGTAVSVANDISVGWGIVNYFLGSLVAGLIIGAISFAIGLMVAFMVIG